MNSTKETINLKISQPDDNLRRILDRKIFLLDIDGTLALGNEILPYTEDLIGKLLNKGKHVYFLTNNTSKTSKDIFQKFSHIDGITINNIVTPLYYAIDFFNNANMREIYWVATREVSEELRRSGLNKSLYPDALLLTFDIELTYDKLSRIAELIMDGVPYFATNGDMICPSRTGVLPDTGSFITLLGSITGEMPMIFGKPEIHMASNIVKKHDMYLSDAVIIGDRLDTDIAMASHNDLASIWISGPSKEAQKSIKEAFIFPDVMADNLESLFHIL